MTAAKHFLTCWILATVYGQTCCAPTRSGGASTDDPTFRVGDANCAQDQNSGSDGCRGTTKSANGVSAVDVKLNGQFKGLKLVSSQDRTGARDDEAASQLRGLILKQGDFGLHLNGSLFTELQDKYSFPEKYFLHKNDTAYLCFPMPVEFINCDKWIIGMHLIDYRNNSRGVRIHNHKEEYKVHEYIHHKRDDGIVLCQEKETEAKKRRDRALLVAWFLSAICLAVLIVLSQFFTILNMKNNKILLCNLGVLFVAYVMLAVKQLSSSPSPTACAFGAYFQQYIFLSAFCWINVQAVDVFLKFINLRVSPADKSQKRKQFILYSIHGWITPLMVTLITGMVEALDKGHINPKLSEFCWFRKKDKGLAFLFFFGPISLILIINLVLFILTVYKLCTIGKKVNAIKKGAQKELFKVYIKLIFVMGLSWTMEVVSVGVGSDDQDWNVPDMVNALQGVFIFIVYTCKRIFMRRIFDSVCRHPKCPPWWPCKPHAMSPNGNEATCSPANSTGGTRASTSQPVQVDKLQTEEASND